VACTGGTLFAISPWLGLIAFGTFVIILLFFRYVSLGSIICMFLPTFMIFIPGIDYLYLFDHSLLFKDSYKPDWVTHVYLLCIMLCNSFLVIVRHVPNIRRLINHEERKIF
jgi:glycerol-3-phosphate acyltransferase PlsY